MFKNLSFIYCIANTFIYCRYPCIEKDDHPFNFLNFVLTIRMGNRLASECKIWQTWELF